MPREPAQPGDRGQGGVGEGSGRGQGGVEGGVGGGSSKVKADDHAPRAHLIKKRELIQQRCGEEQNITRS